MDSLARILLLALVALGLGATVQAHPLAPSLLEIVEREPGRAEVKWKTPAVVVPGSELRPVLPAHCRPVQYARAEVIETAVVRRWEIACEAPLEGSSIEVSGIASSRADVILRVALADGRLFSSVLTEGRATFVVPARQGAVVVGWRYAVLGFDHIVTGYDHLLFVLGLLLLVRNKGQLVATVTAFTVGHSVTLSLAALGLVAVPSRPVEALIALSILFLAVELARGSDAGPTMMRCYPWALTSAFGLLHGLGFAGALTEIGLPAGEIPLALFSFNLGIEAGQLAFCAVVLLVLAAGRRLRPVKLGRAGVTTAAYAIGSLAGFWLVDRLAAGW
jgi:hydrogenase/urease accessory protein HupE